MRHLQLRRRCHCLHVRRPDTGRDLIGFRRHGRGSKGHDRRRHRPARYGRGHGEGAGRFRRPQVRGRFSAQWFHAIASEDDPLGRIAERERDGTVGVRGDLTVAAITQRRGQQEYIHAVRRKRIGIDPEIDVRGRARPRIIGDICRVPLFCEEVVHGFRHVIRVHDALCRPGVPRGVVILPAPEIPAGQVPARGGGEVEGIPFTPVITCRSRAICRLRGIKIH